VDDAIAVFDKVIAADPTKADAYYWKGVNLIGKMTLKDGKMVAPDGTAEAFQKYLELAPTGRYAQPAKDMLASIGALPSKPASEQPRRNRRKKNPVLSSQFSVSGAKGNEISIERQLPALLDVFLLGTGNWELQLPRSMTYLSFALPHIRATFIT
jgi:hypothetical protein